MSRDAASHAPAATGRRAGTRVPYSAARCRSRRRRRASATRPLFYAGEDEFLAGTVPFVRAGIDAGEPILVALPERRAAALERALEASRGRRLLRRHAAARTQPGRIISAWHDFVAAGPDRRTGVRGIGEPAWPGRSAAELDECRRHEALLNAAFADGPDFVLLCPYDVEGLPEAVVQEARGTHPYVCEHGGCAASDTYLPPDRRGLRGRAASPRRTTPTCCASTSGVLRDRARPRRHPRARGGPRVGAPRRRRLGGHRAGGQQHPPRGGLGTLRVWRDGSALLVEVEDAGRLQRAAASAACAPRSSSRTGAGLWLVHQLCDLVQVRSCGGRTIVRARMEPVPDGVAA